jgi:predicted nucleic acid-binding protein
LSVVVDSSVLVAALVDAGPHGTWAEQIMMKGALQAPDLVRVEATNILRRLERAKQITTPEANAAHDDLMQLDLEMFSFDPFSDRIWELRHNVTSYDAWYVAVAEALGLPLATLDVRLSKAQGPTCEFLIPSESQISRVLPRGPTRPSRPGS